MRSSDTPSSLQSVRKLSLRSSSPQTYGAHDMDEITRSSAPKLRPKRPFKLGRKTQDASRDAVMKDPAPTYLDEEALIQLH